ncbi:hypothetical protein GOBAR_AA07199 [Gossypium barbadense]|uniref:Uncharacterized protein n=1 Tax=Gossypium barbadense TaxID=3634 RepID=A0A2P5YCV9_GOSBA|nr:hypothetical protein GOBAR_AA07199 [Gossypium barbadense]
MSSHSIHHLFLCSSTIPSSSLSFSYNHVSILAGTWQSWGKDKGHNVDIHRLCRAISKPRTQEYAGVFQNGLPVIKWNEIVDDDIQGEAFKTLELSKIKEHVDNIRSMLGSMGDGEISCSAYDTAWVALIEDVNGNGSPQFPSTLEWISDNQLPDGSWGDKHIFLAHDRLINTLACVVALKTWNLHPDKCQKGTSKVLILNVISISDTYIQTGHFFFSLLKGLSFFKENISKLEDEKAEHMPIGFEVAFPSLLETARSLSIEVPYDSPIFQNIYEQRDLKLTRIPKEIMHNVATTLLHSLEGMLDLDWEKLLKLQCQDGSFLFSPSSTAYAVMQTKNENCLNYLTKIVQRFNGGVPNVYPVDLFEHIWAIDRLQRLGISRYFNPEIKQCLDYTYRHWTQEGICWARNTRVQDIDDTAMGFRLLRLHGYEVSADVFRHFEKGGEFFCFVGQSNQAVGFALKFPWLASLPRVETRFYIEQYGGEDEVWIGKTLYRMPYVNNNAYLELAKLDFNNCQALHQMEWNGMQRQPVNPLASSIILNIYNDVYSQWYSEMGLGDFGMSRRSLLLSYFMAAASIFEPERSQERLAWAKTAFLVETIASSFHNGIPKPSDYELRKRFVQVFTSLGYAPFSHFNGRKLDSNRTMQKLIDALLRTLNYLSLDALVAHGRDISRDIRRAWEKWMLKWAEEGDTHQEVAELVVQTINLTSGYWPTEELVPHPQYLRLSNLINTVCHQLCHYQKQEVHDNGCFNNTDTDQSRTRKIESAMQELVQVVLENSSDDIDSGFKQTFLTVAQSFYYAAHCDLETIIFHIAKVLFEKVH